VRDKRESEKGGKERWVYKQRERERERGFEGPIKDP